MLLPITTCTICGLNALSPEARCKTFDASGDGYGRGEAFGGKLFSLFSPQVRNLASDISAQSPCNFWVCRPAEILVDSSPYSTAVCA
jgi:hypothetical protein